MKLLTAALLCVTLCDAQLIPEGTKVRVRLENTITSATAQEGETVELSVVEPVKIGDVTAFAEGARATGTVVEAHEKRRLGRAGKLDFSVDRVKGIDNQWVPVRYTVNKRSGESHAVQTGILTAGVALVFWPAAPVMLLIKGKDITINRGMAFDVYTDGNHTLLNETGSSSPVSVGQQFGSSGGGGSATATVTVTSNVANADIEIDGTFMGNTPTTIQMKGGSHQVAVRANGKIWERVVQVNPGSMISLSATLN
jgi:PEGA domain